MTSYKCQFCDRILYVENNVVEVCQCEKSQQAELEQKERDRQFSRKSKISFDEARFRNKVPLRQKPNGK
jgi:hypothetical protein